MAKIANTRKNFNFRIEIAGVDEWEVQKVTIPEVEIQKVMHGDANYDVKTPGRVTVGDCVMEKIRPLNGSDTWAWDRLMVAQNTLTGGSLLPLQVREIIVIKEMDATGTRTLNRWLCEGAWVCKVASSQLDRMSSDNMLETVTWSVDRCYRV